MERIIQNKHANMTEKLGWIEVIVVILTCFCQVGFEQGLQKQGE